MKWNNLGPVYMRPGWSETGMKIGIVNMFTWEWYENHKIFNLFPLPGNFLFHMAFVGMCCSNQCQGYSRDRSEMYLCLHSSWSEFMPVWSQSARSSRRNDLRPVWVIFDPVACKHLLSLVSICDVIECQQNFIKLCNH
jgi:hypothetical protein